MKGIYHKIYCYKLLTLDLRLITSVALHLVTRALSPPVTSCPRFPSVPAARIGNERNRKVERVDKKRERRRGRGHRAGSRETSG